MFSGLGRRAGKSPIRARCALVIPLVAMTLVAACSSSGGDTAAPGTEKNPSLVVAVTLLDPVRSSELIASTEGFFTKNNVDVDLKVLGGSTLNSLVSGQIDVAVQSTGTAFAPVVQGKSTSIIFAEGGGGMSGSLVVPATSSARSIEDLAGKRVAISGSAGSASWGYAQAYTRYLVAKGLAPLDLIPMASATATQSVASGSVDGMVGAAAYFGGSAVKQRVRFIVDGSTTEGQSTFAELGIPKDMVEASAYGITDNLRNKRVAVERFVKAIKEASAWIQEKDSTTIAESLRKFPGFEKYGDVPDIAHSVDLVKVNLAPAGGSITPEAWQGTLKELSNWEIPGFTAEDPKWSFDNRVDMSFLDAKTQ